MADEKDNSKQILLISSVVVLIIVLGLWFWTYFALKNDDCTDRGTFGDMFGAINSLFSGLAFGGIILTIILQTKELSLQRQELKETRKELKRTATAQENSEVVLKRQAENLKATAKLSALGTLLNYYDSELNRIGALDSGHPNLSELSRKRTECVDQIEAILNDKTNN